MQTGLDNHGYPKEKKKKRLSTTGSHCLTKGIQTDVVAENKPTGKARDSTLFKVEGRLKSKNMLPFNFQQFEPKTMTRKLVSFQCVLHLHNLSI